jgi:hypothetical protein
LAGASAALVLTAGEPACRRAGAALFPGISLTSAERDELRPAAPFEGTLFGLFSAQPRGVCVALVVPALWVAAPREGREQSPSAGGAAPGVPPIGSLLPIADHVNLELRSPLAGRWPAGVPRDFPSMTGVYQPGLVRARAGARVYSSAVVAAGVADCRGLTDFEVRALREGGLHVVTDSLVPVAVIAAYYGLRLAACGLVRAPERDRE